MRPRTGAFLALLTVAVTWLWAHEGHKALPVHGVVVDADKGRLVLSPPVRAALGVATAAVTEDQIEERLTVPAAVVAPWQRRAFATTRAGGRVTALHARAGQVVTAGQVLAEVESLEVEDLRLELQNAENDVRLGAATVKDLEAGVQRGAVPELQLLEAQAKLESEQNAVVVARHRLALLDALAAREGQPLPVRSLVNGVVTHVDVQVDQVVEPAQHLFEVVDLSTVWIRAGILEKDLARVEPGQSLRLRLPSDPGGRAFDATIRLKGRALDPQNHLGTAWATLINPPGDPLPVRPGIIGQAEIRLGVGPRRRVVPEAAVVRSGAERYVLVQEGPGQYLRQNVVTGRRRGGLVEVLDGSIYPGDHVVTVGSHELGSLFFAGVLRPSREALAGAGIRVERVGRHPVAEVVHIPGEVDVPPDHRAAVSARLGGTVRRILVEPEQSVAAGAVLAEVASPELQSLQLDLLRAELDATVQARALDRLRGLAGSTVPPRRIREAENASQAARRRRDSLARKLRAAGLTEEQVRDATAARAFVDLLPVRAPFAGTVVQFQATLGQVVKAAEPLAEVHDLSRPLVQGFVSEGQQRQVRVGQRARIRLAGAPDIEATGTVVRSGDVFGPDSRTLSVWIDWERAPAQPLAHGMLCDVTLVVAEGQPVLSVPLSAVLRDGTQSFVFVRDANGTFERRRVGLGREDERRVAVLDGLVEDETVAVQGVNELQAAYAAVR